MRGAGLVLLALVAQEPKVPERPPLPAHHRLGAPIELPEHHVVFRTPAGWERIKEDGQRRIYYGEAWPLDWSGGRVAVNLVEEHASLDDATKHAREWYEGRGLRFRAERRTYDAVLGTSAELQFATEHEGETAVMTLLYLKRGGRWFYLQFEYGGYAETLWRRTIAAIVRSFRVTDVRDARLDAPPGAAERTAAGLTLVVETRGKKAPSDSDTARVASELAAGLRFASALTGGEPLAPPPTVHCFVGPKPLQAVIPGADLDTPTALYVPEGRLLLAHLGKTRRAGKGSADRQAAALWAYVDCSTGSMWGLFPWIEAGIVEAAFAARPDGETLVPRLRECTVAEWIKKQAKRAEWPAIDAFVRRRTTLGEEREQAYAIALVLAAHGSDDPARRDVLPRYFAALREHGDPEGALDRALEGVDLAAWDAAARALLKAG